MTEMKEMTMNEKPLSTDVLKIAGMFDVLPINRQKQLAQDIQSLIDGASEEAYKVKMDNIACHITYYSRPEAEKFAVKWQIKSKLCIEELSNMLDCQDKTWAKENKELKERIAWLHKQLSNIANIAKEGAKM